MIDKTNWTPVNLAWLAGVLEGEGYFGPMICRSGRQAGNVKLVVSLKMTDEDVVKKAYDIAGFGHFNGPYQDKVPDKKLNRGEGLVGYKPYWTWESQLQADVYDFEITILPYMGERRSMQILTSHEARRSYELVTPGRNTRRIFTTASSELLPDSACIPV